MNEGPNGNISDMLRSLDRSIIDAIEKPKFPTTGQRIRNHIWTAITKIDSLNAEA